RIGLSRRPVEPQLRIGKVAATADGGIWRRAPRQERFQGGPQGLDAGPVFRLQPVDDAGRVHLVRHRVAYNLGVRSLRDAPASREVDAGPLSGEIANQP